MMNALVFRKSFKTLAAGFAYTRLTGKPAVFNGGPLSLEKFDEPELPGAGWIRVASRMSGICGSDLHLLRLDASFRSSVMAWRDQVGGEPVFPGHETTGEVIETRSQRFRLGDRVLLVPGFHCRALGRDPGCPRCREGSFSHCAHRNERPAFRNVAGGWSERFIRHETQLIACPDNVPDEVAC